MIKLLAEFYEPTFAIAGTSGHLMFHLVSDRTEKVNSTVRPGLFSSEKILSGQRSP